MTPDSPDGEDPEDLSGTHETADEDLRWLGEAHLAAGATAEARELLTRAVASLSAGQAEAAELTATRDVLARAEAQPAG